MPLSRLPTEIVSHITSYLPRFCIISASLVCRAWRLVLLRTLYHSVKLVEDRHAVHFANTITSDGVAGLSHYIPQLITSLGIGSEWSMYITGLGLAHLESCIMHLIQLRRFHCHIILSASENLELFRLVQTQCLQLESVGLHFVGADVSKIESSQLTTLFGFRNLVNYSLRMRYILWDIDSGTLAPLKALVINCPNLESLTLDFSFSFDDSGPKTTYNLDLLPDLFAQDLIMPDLHTLHLCGDVEMDIGSILSSPTTGSYLFRDFLSRHPQIRDLKLGWLHINGSYKNHDMHPDNLGLALPSLRRCSAPVFICAHLVCSAVATQLEHLEVRGRTAASEFAFEALPMPMLRVLLIKIDYDVLKVMRLIMPVANRLEHLCLTGIRRRHHTEFLELLTHTPNLQTVSMDYLEAYSCQQLVGKIKTMYPKLKIVGSPGREY
ncbi:unnamed protein product [Rhizoctonia solani]|uniref:F-box domain-containing protein n=1 Tax=Rhizoctonia solani TaxID=456999 RepID=A0A8H3C251_9AGAM|nr:unnamed protein product [Rhizoctonia solani]